MSGDGAWKSGELRRSLGIGVAGPDCGRRISRARRIRRVRRVRRVRRAWRVRRVRRAWRA